MQFDPQFIIATTHPELHASREIAKTMCARGRIKEMLSINILAQSDEVLEDMASVAKVRNMSLMANFLRDLAQVRAGAKAPEELKCPNLFAFGLVLQLVLRKKGQWIFRAAGDDALQPYLVRSLREREDREDNRWYVELGIFAHPLSDDMPRNCGRTVCLTPASITRKQVPDILREAGFVLSNDGLMDRYRQQLARVEACFAGAMGQQFKDTSGRRYILDSQVPDGGLPQPFDDAFFSEESVEAPYFLQVKLFSLQTHRLEAAWTTDVEPYVYDEEIASKIVLPVKHERLLDVLMTESKSLTNDIIQGKAAGNVIVTQGPPGVGKTLTTEVYCEKMKVPFISIRAGDLGVSASQVEEALTRFFRWGEKYQCPLLLDEADVFVAARGTDLTLNAVVSVFLRRLEYFDGLIFLTTNRMESIDDAIYSRALAIIRYERPTGDAARRVWQIMADNFGWDAPAALLARLSDHFNGAAQRDIKMLMRLVLISTAADGKEAGFEDFVELAQYRAMGPAGAAAA